MKLFPLLFVLILFFSSGSYAQSKESGCAKAKECTKTCEEHDVDAGAVIEKEHHKENTIQQQESKQKGEQVTTTKPKTKVVMKKKR